ncbi:fibroleukin-like [Physella acuta]|uniref:fibroleukin-like n=1 Tax=Physella acuta TaxID=109671 RepID=UPI0027DAF1A7|nr:fibroleukin-like [Physella acuta]
MRFSDLVFACVFLLIMGSYGLELAMDRTPQPSPNGEQVFCGQLRCSADTAANKDILTIISMLISDVTVPDKPTTLATITTFHAGSPEKTRPDIEVHGSISRYHADITVDFTNQSDCLQGSFSCELDFVNISGLPDALKAVVLAENLDRNFTNSELLRAISVEISNQMAKMETTLRRLINDLSLKLNNVNSSVAEVQNMAEIIKGDLTLLGANFHEGTSSNLGSVVDSAALRNLSLQIETAGESVLNEVKGLRDVLTANSSLLQTSLSLISQDVMTLKQDVNVSVVSGISQMSQRFQDFTQNYNHSSWLLESRLDNITLTTSSGFQFVKSFLLPDSCVRGMLARESRVVFKLDDQKYALCDTQTDGGGWIVIQRRTKGDTNFSRTWDEYRDGFGSVDGDLWLGNEKVHQLTTSRIYELRIDMNGDHRTHYAYYSRFQLGDERSHYALHLTGFKGDVQDIFTDDQYNNWITAPYTTPKPDGFYDDKYGSVVFSTADNVSSDLSYDYHCLDLYGGWWLWRCQDYPTNLNGEWGDSSSFKWGDLFYSSTPTFVEMKIRLV